MILNILRDKFYHKKRQLTFADCCNSKIVLRKFLLRTDRANGNPIEAAVAVHAVTAKIEAKEPRAVRTVRVERTRPAVYDGTGTVELTITAVASSGQENSVAVRTDEQASVYTVLGCPSCGTVIF